MSKNSLKNIKGALNRDEMKSILGGSCTVTADCGGGVSVSCSSSTGTCSGTANSVSCKTGNTTFSYPCPTVTS